MKSFKGGRSQTRNLTSALVGRFHRRVAIGLVAVALGLSGRSGAAIAVVDGPAPNPLPEGTGTSISQSVTVSSGAAVLVVELATKGASSAYTSPTSLSWNGQTLARAVDTGYSQSNYRRCAIYYLFNPPPGTANCTGTGGSGTAYWALKSFTLAGVDPALAPLTGATNTGTGQGSSLSFDVASCPANGWAAVCANWSDYTGPLVFTLAGGTVTATSDYFSTSADLDGMGYISGVSSGTQTFQASAAGGSPSTPKANFVAAIFTPGLTAPPTNSVPVITNIVVKATEVELSGTNGTPNAFYQVVAAPDIALPKDAWPALVTNTFDAGGNFDSTLPLSTDPLQLYQVRVAGGGTPPFITSAPTNQTVIAGQNATFTVGAGGAAPLGYQWYFAGSTLPGSTATLNVTNAQADDAGEYFVTVSNSYGMATSSFATLTVLLGLTPPFITSPPQDQTVAVGQNATFTVVAGGSLPLYYQWYFNTNTLLANATNAAQTLTNVQTNDEGDYHVVITNSLGSITSQVARLTLDAPVTPYPSVPGASASTSYSVTVDGQQVFVTRYKDISYAHFAFSGAVTVNVLVSSKVSSYSISPHSYSVSASTNGQTLAFSLSQPRKLILKINSLEPLFLFADPPESNPPQLGDANVVNVGTYAGVNTNGNTTCTAAIQSAIDAASSIGGVAFFPAGKYMTGTLKLKSNMTMYLAPGALIQGTHVTSDYPLDPGRTESGTEGVNMTFSRLILIGECTNVTIRGRGVIDGDGKVLRANGRAANLIRVRSASNVLLDGVILRDPAAWNTHLLYSQYVTVRNVKLINDTSNPNTDGINPDASQHVTIEDVFMYCGDDNVAVKSTANSDLLQDVDDVTVRGCVFWTKKSSLKVGTETRSTYIRNVLFENNDVVHADRALSIYIKDGTKYENGRYIDNRTEYIGGDSGQKLFDWTITVRNGVGSVSNILVRNFSAESFGVNNAVFAGYDSTHKISDVAFENLWIAGQRRMSLSDARITTNSYVTNVTFSQ